MPRKAKWNRDGTSDAPKPIDLRLDGLEAVGERLQLSSGVLVKSAFDARVNAIKEAWALGGVHADAVRALAKKRFTLAAFMQARAGGIKALEDLLRASGSEPLADLTRDYVKQLQGEWVHLTEQKLDRYAAFLGENATVAQVTAASVRAFLDGLTDKRTESRDGSSQKVAMRARVVHDPRWPAKAPKPAKGSTKNRYRAALSGLCTWAVNAGRMTEHPIALKKVPKSAEPHHRLPEMSPDEYRDYLAAARALRPDLVIVLLTLIHTAPDVGEIWTLMAKDCDLDLGRLRYDRHKTARYGPLPRFVPMPSLLREEMRAHLAEYGVRGSQLLFTMLARNEVEWLHRQARAAIARPELTLKDLRHVAAIAWVQAGVHIRLVQRWLGHRSLAMTMKYTDYEPGAEMAVEMAERAADTLNQTADVTPIRKAQ